MYAEILMVVMHFSCVMLTPTYNCELPVGCEIKDVQYIIDYTGNEKTSIRYPGILCDIRNETFKFYYSMQNPVLIHDSEDLCHVSSSTLSKDIMELRFPSNFILGKQFNIQKIGLYVEL